jgi:REP element-mobilizing transposase RayT
MRDGLFGEAGRELVQKVLDGLTNRFPDWIVDTKEIMPNHVHIIFECISDKSSHSLSDVVGAFKSLVCREFRMQSRNGQTVWQRNYYERIIRNEFELYAVREYIKRNPKKERFDWDEVFRESLKS